jgi:hypothetical protein
MEQTLLTKELFENKNQEQRMSFGRVSTKAHGASRK